MYVGGKGEVFSLYQTRLRVIQFVPSGVVHPIPLRVVGIHVVLHEVVSDISSVASGAVHPVPRRSSILYQTRL